MVTDTTDARKVINTNIGDSMTWSKSFKNIYKIMDKLMKKKHNKL